jgi:hypothetical protein
MLTRQGHLSRPVAFALGAAICLGIVILGLWHYQAKPIDPISSFLTPSDSPQSPLSAHEIPSIPSECSSKHFDPPSPGDSDTQAVALSPAELLCRQIDPRAPGIPKLFHQSWKDNELPVKFQRWSKGCREQHKGWEWVLWTDDDNLKLVQTYFPWLEEAFNGLPGPIYRADFARNLYMYMYGGVYADLDTDCLRPTDEALKPFRIPFLESMNQNTSSDNALQDPRGVAVFGRLGDDETFEHSIPNAWMASTPRHPFFFVPMYEAKAAVEKSKTFFHRWIPSPNAEHITGPIALRKSIFRWKESLRDLWDEVVLLPNYVVYPYSWHTPGSLGGICSAMFATLDEAKCQEGLKVKEKGSLSVTYWSQTHKGTGHNDKTIAQISHER